MTRGRPSPLSLARMPLAPAQLPCPAAPANTVNVATALTGATIGNRQVRQKDEPLNARDEEGPAAPNERGV